jgi:hypothetical protein
MNLLKKVKEEFARELSSATSDMESNMIRAEYNYRIQKLEKEGPEAYELAYVIPNQVKDEDCGCGKD